MFVLLLFFFFFQAEDGIRDFHVTGVQTCALPISAASVGQFAAYFLFEEQGVEPDVHLVGNQLLGSVQIDDSDQRVPGLDAEQLVEIGRASCRERV